jgi:hypothetical protein
MFGLVGFLTVIFNVVLGSLRQVLTPDRLLGRVISAFRLPGLPAGDQHPHRRRGPRRGRARAGPRPA